MFSQWELNEKGINAVIALKYQIHKKNNKNSTSEKILQNSRTAKKETDQFNHYDLRSIQIQIMNINFVEYILNFNLDSSPKYWHWISSVQILTISWNRHTLRLSHFNKCQIISFN